MNLDFLKDKAFEIMNKTISGRETITRKEFETIIDHLEETLKESEIANKEPVHHKSEGEQQQEDHRNTKFLAHTALEMVEMETFKEVSEYVCENLYQQLEGKAIITVVDYYTEKNLWKMVSFKGVNNIKKLASLTGINLESLSGSVETQFFENLKKGTLTPLDFDIPALTNGKLSQYQGSQVKRLFSIESLYCITFTKSDTILGNVSIFTRKGCPPLNKHLIEAFISQASQFLQQIHIRQQLKKALKKAEQSDRLKSSFLNNISHEVRTPMTGIIGFVELLKQPGLTEEEKNEYTDIITKSSNRLLILMENLMDISLLQTDQVQANEKSFNLNELLDELSLVYKPTAESKGLDFKLKKDLTDENSIIKADPLLLEKTLKQLLNNAFKYTEKGLVRAGYKYKGDHLEIFVSDSGIGIEPELKDEIFDYFRQAELGINRRYEGSGLGLSLAKSYVSLMGGSLNLKSTVDKGSTFYFSIAYKPK
ncbi:MAG: HAMP domain-containing sensor histidine kinase [Bacteroidales bacterium]